jgi:hypothetical protein
VVADQRQVLIRLERCFVEDDIPRRVAVARTQQLKTGTIGLVDGEVAGVGPPGNAVDWSGTERQGGKTPEDPGAADPDIGHHDLRPADPGD